MNQTVIGILAHVDAGKTTLSEGLLYLGKSTRHLGRVDNRDAFLDTDLMEKDRGITIFSKEARFHIGDRPFTLLDTPGHTDFSAEMERTLQVLDLAILVVSGADGVQGHTLTLWRLLNQYKIPVFIFVNKMDQAGTDHDLLMDQIRRQLDDACIDFGKQDGDFYEQLAMCDEKVMEAYLASGEISREEICRLAAERKVFPCFFGSALKLEGVAELMAGMNSYFLPPVYPADFAGRVFKIGRDSQNNRMTFMKVTGGQLKVKDEIGGEKVNQIRLYNGLKYETAETAEAGTICAVTGPMKTRAGDGLGAETGRHLPVLEPVLTCSVILPQGLHASQAMDRLRQLEEEIPELQIVWEEEVGEIQVRLMGDIQTEILERMLLERFGLGIRFGEGRILYKETIRNTVEGVGHFEPLRHYAEVHLLLEPDERGSGLTFASRVSENDLDRNWQRLILTHLGEKIHKGVLTGAPITDMKITLIAGKAHTKHTEGGDFRQATYRAVRQGLMKAESEILEPFYAFRLEIPASQVGRAMTDIERMSGSFSLESSGEETAVITGQAPVATMRTYQRELAAYTGGRGQLSCTLAGYGPCHDPAQVYEAAAYDPEADLRNTPDSVFCAHGAGFIVPWYEVENYMHLDGAGVSVDTARVLEEAALKAQTSARQRQTGRNESRDLTLADEKELEQIFVRTFGEIRRKTYDSTRTIKAPGEDDYVYKPNPKKKDLPHYLLVDGYNIIFGWEDLADLAGHDMGAARDRLMEILSNYQGYTKLRIILVFDAYKVAGFTGEVIHWHNIDVVFTKEAETADQYIEKTAHEIGRRYKVTVATSDGTEQVIIRSQGCLLLSARDLREEIDRTMKELRETHLSKTPKTGNYLGSYIPADYRPEES